MERVEQRRVHATRMLLDQPREQLRRWLIAVPDLTLDQLQQKLGEDCGVQISRAQVARALKRMGLRLKKVTPRQRTGPGRKLVVWREEFVERLLRDPAGKAGSFFDESGVTTRMTRLYARALGGVRVHEGAPEGDWQILTILGAMSSRGMIAAMTIEAATDGEIFLAFLDEVWYARPCTPATWW